MIEIIQGVRPGENSRLDDAMRLRHQVFVNEKGWNALRKPDGRETDQFDTRATVHQIAVHNDRVVGYQRLNPTLGPHLLSEVHPFMCDRTYERGPHAWEWSRYCVDPAYRAKSTFCDVGSTLLIAAIEWAVPNGVSNFVIELNPVWLTRFLELGFQVTPLGLPTEFDGEPTVAVLIGFDNKTAPRMCEMRKIPGPVLSRQRVAVPTALAS